MIAAFARSGVATARSRRGGSRPTWPSRAGDEGHLLAREQQRGRAVGALDGGGPGDRGLDRVARTPDVHARDQAQARRVLDRLVRRAVLAQADGVVREDEDHPLLHQRRHAQRVARVVGEREEGAAVGNEAAVQRDAVHDRGHAELAHAVVDVAPGHESFVRHAQRARP